MALLGIPEIAALSDEFAYGYEIKNLLMLLKSFTKGARAMGRSETKLRPSLSLEL